jgi:cell wall-associated NlpC family hydrolase
MPRRLLILVVLGVLATAANAQAASWADPQIRIVVGRGLMAPTVATFRPTNRLTRRALGQLLAGLTGRQQVVVNPDASVTVAELDAALVRAVGLGGAAYKFRTKTRAAGLQPPIRFGTEVVARLLRLRFNHPPEADNLEELPTDAITRAETAYSVARVLALTQGDLQWANWLATTYVLPPYTVWQRRVLTRAVRFVGFPYVWGGMWEFPESPFGVRARGGFDCSGFAWRVYKLQPYTDAPRLGTTIHGRTTYAMSGEIPVSQRIPRGHLRAADLVFFGDRGTRSTPLQVGHMGIYLGRGWFIHSSSQGVTVVPLTDWYATSFAWGRRPLREVGLS